MKSGITLLAITIITSTVLSTANAQKKTMSESLRGLVETEEAFASRSRADGMKAAFLAFAADDGVLFRRTVVNAKELWNKANPAPTGLLTWRPSYADISSSGDMGYTFGPWEFRAKPEDKEAGGSGHFVTVWRKQADGSWKFEVDIGVSHGAHLAGSESDVEHPSSKAKRPNSAQRDLEAAKRELLIGEALLSTSANNAGFAKALISVSDENIRLFRPDTFPIVGKRSVQSYLEGKNEIVTWKATTSAASRSADLGYTYGSFETRAKASDATPTSQGHFVRIWKRNASGEWRIVVDVINPVPVAAQ